VKAIYSLKFNRKVFEGRGEGRKEGRKGGKKGRNLLGFFCSTVTTLQDCCCSCSSLIKFDSLLKLTEEVIKTSTKL